MIIKALKVSNILSFEHKEHFQESEPDLVFGNGLNIIVGANGSGKSNFIAIISTLFQSYFLEPYEYNYAYDTEAEGIENRSKYLQKKVNTSQNLRLEKHNNSTDKPSYVELMITLSEADKNNLNFLKTNIAEMANIPSKFSSDNLDTTQFPIETTDVNLISDVMLKFKITNENHNIGVSFKLELENVDTEPINEELVKSVNQKRVVDFYLRNFDLFKKIIATGNDRDNKAWQDLSISFEFMGAHRTVSGFSGALNFDTVQETAVINNRASQKNLNIKTDSDINYIFSVPFAKIGTLIARDYTVNQITAHGAIKKQFEQEDALMSKINKLLKEYLNLELKYHNLPPPTVKILNIDIYKSGTDTKMNFNQLSSGQRSIFSLIFLVVGLEIENGFLVIDEPELHLHPRLQKKYFELLKKFSQDSGLQSILVTHSPVFIDEKTIKYTYRFYKEDDKTKIIKPKDLDTDDEELIKFLSYTNSSKIFFTDKVVLVEGDTDNYFFTYYLNNHTEINEDMEFLTIGGKGNHEKWSKFLKKFQIKNSFITDFDFLDQAKDLGIEEAKDEILSKEITLENLKRIKDSLSEKTTSVVSDFIKAIDLIKNKELKDLTDKDLMDIKKAWLILYKKRIKFVDITSIIEKNPITKAKVEAKLAELRQQDIYVLRWGDLEDYLSIRKKRLQEVVDYCANGKYTEMENHLKEDLKSIFTEITK